MRHHVLGFVALYAAACSGSAPTNTTPAAVATVSVTPVTAIIAPSETVPLSATLRDASNAILTERAVTWSSSSSIVASVDASGLVTAVTPGSAVITATVEGKSGQATITVASSSGGALSSIGLSAGEGPFAVGQSVTLAVIPRDSHGNPLTGVSGFTFASSDPTVASVRGPVVKMLSVGTTIVTVSVGGISRQVTIDVEP